MLCGEEFIQRSNRQKACRTCRAKTDGHRSLGETRLPDPICADCQRPYPRRGGPLVTRCVECQGTHDDPGHSDRLRRIEASAPPVQSFDGRVQKWRDDQAEDLEVEWNGTMGRGGKSITEGAGLGSSLSGAELTRRR